MTKTSKLLILHKKIFIPFLKISIKIGSKRERRQYNKRTDNKTAKLSLKSALNTVGATTNGKFSKSMILSKFDSTVNNQQATNQFYKSSDEARISNQFKKTELGQEIQEENEEESVDLNDQDRSINNDFLLINNLISIEHGYLERLEQDLDQHGLMKKLKQSLNPIDNKTLINNDINLLKQLIVDSVNCECQAIIKWASLLPNFNLLSIEDRTNSIEFNFLEVLIINFIWRSVIQQQQQQNEADNNNNNNNNADVKFVLNKNLTLSQSDCNSLELDGIYDHITSIVNKLKKLKITQEEYLSLKALALFKSDYGFMNLDQLENFRNKCFQTLKQSTIKASNQMQQQQQQNRYEYYLILLTDIKSISMRFMHYIIMFNNDFIEMPTLLNDMFITQNMFGLTAQNFMKFNNNNNNSSNEIIKNDNEAVLMKKNMSFKNEPSSSSSSSASSSSSSSMDENSDDFTNNNVSQNMVDHQHQNISFQ